MICYREQVEKSLSQYIEKASEIDLLSKESAVACQLISKSNTIREAIEERSKK